MPLSGLCSKATDEGYWSPVLFAQTGDADLGFIFSIGS